jgi:hypothetical protein
MSEKLEFETFRKLGAWDIGNMTQKEPSCFNGMVRFKKYRVTVEVIDEPVEVYQDRLQKMWDTCDNHHHWEPLKKAAKSVGLELHHRMGGKR